MWGRHYTTTCGRDLNTIRRGLRLRRWDEDEIKAEWLLRKSLVIPSFCGLSAWRK